MTAATVPTGGEEQYHALADAMPQIVWTARPDGTLDYYNRRWFDYTGTTLDETGGRRRRRRRRR